MEKASKTTRTFSEYHSEISLEVYRLKNLLTVCEYAAMYEEENLLGKSDVNWPTVFGLLKEVTNGLEGKMDDTP